MCVSVVYYQIVMRALLRFQCLSSYALLREISGKRVKGKVQTAKVGNIFTNRSCSGRIDTGL